MFTKLIMVECSNFGHHAQNSNIKWENYFKIIVNGLLVFKLFQLLARFNDFHIMSTFVRSEGFVLSEGMCLKLGHVSEVRACVRS